MRLSGPTLAFPPPVGPWWDPVKTLRPHCLILDPVVRGTILEAVRLGAFQNAAANYAGIKPALLARWITNGNDKSGQSDPTGEYRKFVQELETAKGKAIVDNLKLLDKIKHTTGKAAIRALLWHLSKQSPKHYGDRIEVTGEVTHRKTYTFLEPAIPVEGQVIDAEGDTGSSDVRRLAEEAGHVEGEGGEDSAIAHGEVTLHGEAPEAEGEEPEEVSDG